MTEQSFLEHHKLSQNPFSDEDAQSDALFKEQCIEVTFHPAWSKVYGTASEPSSAIVLGPKGAGKTAMKLQIIRHLEEHGRRQPGQKVFTLVYDDFNAFLGCIQSAVGRNASENTKEILESIKIWDHLDAILCLATTKLVDLVLTHGVRGTAKGTDSTSSSLNGKSELDRGQKRDLLLLAACYDQSKTGTLEDRWSGLRRAIGYWNLSTWRWLAFGIVATIATIILEYFLIQNRGDSLRGILIFGVILLAFGWFPYVARWLNNYWRARTITKKVRVGRHNRFGLTKLLLQIPSEEIVAQPLPTSDRSDDRYALLEKLQSILRSLGYPNLVVLIDRVDESDLVGGQAERMRDLVWPLMDNKLLKHPGLGIKMLLPQELKYYLDRETREFHERVRLDKQNYVAQFDWTGESLYDVVSARLKACSVGDVPVSPKDLFDASVSEGRLVVAMSSLRTPRNLFRFLYRLISEHCKKHRSDEPNFQISSETFETTLAVFQSELNFHTA